MRKYRLVAKKGEGTFSEVLKAQNVKDGRYHAIKCMKNRFESIDQVNNLREIQALRRLSPHDHVITLEEVLYDQPTGRLALVFELMDANLYELIKGRRHYLNPQLIKSYIWQLMKALDHMHKKGIFHRDIKPENILIESGTEIGRGLKLADFGSCRGIYSKQPYTEYISTRWYRAPECLLTDGYYGPEMDLWGAGCVMFEITSLYPLFPGSNESDQINRIHKILGTPSVEIMNKLKSKGASHISFDFPEQKGVGLGQLIPHAPADSLDLVTRLLKYDNTERITSREAMRHPYLKEMRDQDHKKTVEGASPTSGTAAAAANGKTLSSTGGFGATGSSGINDGGSMSSTQKVVPAQKSIQQQQVSSEDSVISQLSFGTKTNSNNNNNNPTKALPSIDTTGNKMPSGIPKPTGHGTSPSAVAGLAAAASLPPIYNNNNATGQTNNKLLPKMGGSGNQNFGQAAGSSGLFANSNANTGVISNAGSTILGSTQNSMNNGAGGSSNGNKRKTKKNRNGNAPSNATNANANTQSGSNASNGNHSQTAEQVLKNYGIGRNQPPVESGNKSIASSTVAGDGKSAAYPSANRYAIAKKN